MKECERAREQSDREREREVERERFVAMAIPEPERFSCVHLDRELVLHSSSCENIVKHK